MAMKICCIQRSVGGENRMFFTLYSASVRSGAEVHVITNVPPLPGSPGAGSLITHLVGGKLDSQRLRFTQDVRFFTRAAGLFFRLHRKVGFDIIYMSGTNFPAVGLVLSLLAKISGCRSAMAFSSFSLSRDDLKALPELIRPFPLWRRRLYPLAFSLPTKIWSWGIDAIMVPSQIGRSLLKEIRVEDNKIFYIPPGVDLEFFKPQHNQRQPPYRIVYASSCHPWKGISDLLEAFRIASGRGFPLKLSYLFFASRWQSGAVRSDISRLEQEIADKGLSGQVEIRDGPLESIEQAIAQADIIACPIRVSVGTLDIPMSVLEGMACGLPVLGTRVGGLPEAVIDGVNGYLVEPSAPDELAEALVRIIEDPTRMKKMGEESLRLAQRFDVQKSANLLMEIYSALVNH